MKFGLEENIIKKITSVLEEQPKVAKAYIFGSRAKGNYRPDSDIDIAVKGYELTMENILKMSASIDKLEIGYEVDLIDYDSINTEALREHVDRVGQEIFSSWKEFKLGNLIEKGSASLQTGPFGTMLNASEYCPDGTPVIAVQDIGDNKLLHHKLIFVNHEVANRLSRYKVQEDDIIFGRKGAVERRALIKKTETGWIQGSDCIRLRFDKTIDAKFISYQLGSDSNRDWMFQHSIGATMPSMNQEVLKLLPLKLPKLSYQRAISEILGNLDEKIDLLNRQNKILETMAEILFKQWFIENTQGYWNKGRLEDVITVKGGTTPSSSNPDFWNGTISWTTPKDLSDNKSVFLFETERKITSKGLSQIGSGLLPAGTLLLSSRAPIGYLAITQIPVAINQGYIGILCNKGVSNYFMYLWCKSHMGDIHNAGNGSVFQEISKSSFKELELVIPPKKLLDQFDEIVETLFAKIKNNSIQIRNLISFRDTLLPKLISGEALVKMR